MITSEFEYYLISELVHMPDRELAEKIELHVWYNTFVPQPKILAMYLKALKESLISEDFYEAAKKLIQESGIEFAQI